MRVIPLLLRENRSALEHSIQLVDQQRDCLVAVVAADVGVHLGSVAGEVALRHKPTVTRTPFPALQFHPNADDAPLVAKEPRRLLTHKGLQRRRESEVEARNDYLGRIGLVHDSDSPDLFLCIRERHSIARAPVFIRSQAEISLNCSRTSPRDNAIEIIDKHCH